MDYMIWVWLAVIAVCVVVELITMELVTCWCIFGGIASLILAVCGVGLEWQIPVFVVVSLGLLLGLRKISLKFLLKGDNDKTNTDLLIGKKLKLLSDIGLDDNGTVKINGVVWTAVTADDETIKAGESVEVVELKGNKVIVKKFIEKEIKGEK